jgi:hypothetical protein
MQLARMCCDSVEAWKMDYIKSFGVGLLLAVCGASVWLVWVFSCWPKNL